MAPVLLLVGVALTVAGAALIFWPAALIVVGVCCVAIAFDIRNEAQ